jgi:chromosome segregation ATPase
VADTLEKRVVDLEYLLAHIPEDLDARFAGVDVKLAELRELILLQSSRFTKLETRLNEVSRKVDAQVSQLEGLSRKADAQGGQLEGLSRKVDAQGGQLEGLSRKVDAQGGQLEALSRKADAQGGQLGELSRKLDEVLARLPKP